MGRSLYRIIRDNPHIVELDLIEKAVEWRKTERPDIPDWATRPALAKLLASGEVEYSDGHRLVISGTHELEQRLAYQQRQRARGDR